MGEVKSVFSMCGMCSVRCPIRIQVEDGEPTSIEGNPFVRGVEGALCAKGGAGLAFQNDDERPQSPMMRVGPRGSGQWKSITWDEAADYIAEKLDAITDKHGRRAIALADRGGPFTDLSKSFIKALGSPNYFDHDDTCGKNANMACQSLFGHGRADMIYDFRNTRHIVLYGRNVFESLQVKEVNEILDALDAGAKLTYIDVRATVTASKADNFLMIRPGTDYALNLALIHVLLREHLYDAEFVDKWVVGLPELKRFVATSTPEWAEGETGISAENIVALARSLAEDRPKVIFHGGWMVARYLDSFYSSRSTYILNVLMGNIETRGGLIIAKGPEEAGAAPLRSLGCDIPAPEDEIVDAHSPNGPLGSGHIVNLYRTIKTGEPHPVKALFAYRYDPVASLPDPGAQKAVLDNLDLLVSIDVNYSQTGWYADLILPESTYMERDSIIATQKGASPRLIMRRKATEPRFDSKPAWEIFSLIAHKAGVGDFFPYKTIEDIWRHQLDGTGIRPDDFDEQGFVDLTGTPVLFREDDLRFTTESGLIEFTSPRLKRIGAPAYAPYVRPGKPEEGCFRLTFGRTAVHAHAQSQNNIYLNELVSDNVLWINEGAAYSLGIGDGDTVEVSSNGYTGTIEARVTPHIHPEAVFMLHGFGSDIPLKTRAHGKGLSDTKLGTGQLFMTDPVGGGIAYLEKTVSVRKIKIKSERVA